MPSPAYSILFSAPLAYTVSSGVPGDVLIPDAGGAGYVLSTTANRGTRRSTGVALSPYAPNGVVSLQQFGQLDATTAGLGVGTASAVRVSTLGKLERIASPGTTDDIVGWCETDGTVHLLFGQPPGGFSWGMTASVPVVSAISPTSGSTAGGTSVSITVNSSTGCTSASVGGVVLTSFAIADATHVTGVTGAHAAGASDVVVTNGAGASSPLAGAFTFMGAPTLTSFSTSGGVIGDIDGGYPMAFVGTDFVIGSTTVDFGGTPGTSIVVTSSTAMTCTVPAHISGPVSVTVTTAGGTSGAQSFEYFSPAQLTLTGWWRAGYTAAPWVGTASAGGSGGRNQLTTGTDPTSGTLNSLSTASNSSGRSLVVSGTSMGTLLPAAGYFLEVLCKPASAAAPAAALYLAATPVGESSDGDIGFAYDTGGFKHFHFATAYVGPAYVAAAAGSWYSLAGRYDGTNMAFSVNGAANVTVASGTPNGPGLAASALGAFRNFSTGLGAFAGDVAEIITAAHGSVSTTDQTKIRSYLNTRYFPAGAQV